jgi:hypothetical protein
MGTTWDSRTSWEFKFSSFGFPDLTLTPGGFLFGWLQVDDGPASTDVENRFWERITSSMAENQVSKKQVGL